MPGPSRRTQPGCGALSRNQEGVTQLPSPWHSAQHQIITDFHYQQRYQHLPVTLQSGEILMFCPIRPLPAVLWEEECMRKPSVLGQGTPRTKERLVDALEVQEGHL